MEDSQRHERRSGGRCSSCNRPRCRNSDSSKESRTGQPPCPRPTKRHSSVATSNASPSKCSHKNLQHCFHDVDEIKPGGVCCRCSSYTTKKKAHCHDEKLTNTKRSHRKEKPARKDSCQVEVSQSDEVIPKEKKVSVGIQCAMSKDGRTESMRKLEGIEDLPRTSKKKVGHATNGDKNCDDERGSKKTVEHIPYDEANCDDQRGSKKTVEHISYDEANCDDQRGIKKSVEHVKYDENNCDDMRVSKKSVERASNDGKNCDDQRVNKKSVERLSNDGKNCDNDRGSQKTIEHYVTDDNKFDSPRSSKKPVDHASNDDKKSNSLRSNKKSVERITTSDNRCDSPKPSKKKSERRTVSEKSYDVEVIVSQDHPKQSGMSTSENAMYDNSTNSLKDHLVECEKTTALLMEKLEFKTQIIEDLQRQIEMIDKAKQEAEAAVSIIDIRSSKRSKLECDSNGAFGAKINSDKFECDGNIAIHLELRTVSCKEDLNFATKNESVKCPPDNVHSVTVENE